VNRADTNMTTKEKRPSERRTLTGKNLFDDESKSSYDNRNLSS
jgi:hypothetical protein